MGPPREGRLLWDTSTGMVRRRVTTASSCAHRWSTAIGERVKLSPLVFAGHSELGDLNIWCHIWAYKDANHRAEIREKARKEGIWPPKGGQPGTMLKQENMLVVPASFSPLR